MAHENNCHYKLFMSTIEISCSLIPVGEKTLTLSLLFTIFAETNSANAYKNKNNAINNSNMVNE